MNTLRHLVRWSELMLILWPIFLLGAEPPAVKAPSTNSPAKPSTFKLVTATEQGASTEVKRVFLAAETNKFTFRVPEGFQLQSDAAKKTVTLIADDKIGSVTVQVTEVVGGKAPDIQPEELRQRLLARHNAAKIVDEFAASAGDLSGSAFEVEWIHEGSKAVLAARVAFIPFPGGLLEFNQIAPKAKVRDYDQVLNQVLLSFRHARIDGQFDIAPLSTKI
ncbi:MAG: hypothetical protein AAB676_07140 [Verrucomicrobiota bacterium]